MYDKIEIKDFAKKMLTQDCIDILDATFNVSKKDGPVFALAAAPYICLVTNEAYEWCKRAKINISPFESKTILENIRAKAKLFSNDKIVSFEEQRTAFRKIIRTEHTYYKDLAKPYCPHFLIDDVGTYTINKIYIGNTIQYAYDFQLFSKPNTPIYESGNEIMSFSTEIGSKLQEIVTKLTGEAYKLQYNSGTIQLHTDKNFNFRRKFVQVDNILIFSLICRINYLMSFFKQNCPQNSMLYLRLIYITFYSLKNELDNLKIDYGRIFDGYHDRTFRNCMAHYSLFQKINSNEIMLSAIGYGLIEKYFHIEYSELVKTIEVKLTFILSKLEEQYKC